MHHALQREYVVQEHDQQQEAGDEAQHQYVQVIGDVLADVGGVVQEEVVLLGLEVVEQDLLDEDDVLHLVGQGGVGGQEVGVGQPLLVPQVGLVELQGRAVSLGHYAQLHGLAVVYGPGEEGNVDGADVERLAQALLHADIPREDVRDVLGVELVLDDGGGLRRVLLAELKVVQLWLEEVGVGLFDEREVDLYLLDEVGEEGVLLLVADHVRVLAVYHQPGRREQDRAKENILQSLISRLDKGLLLQLTLPSLLLDGHVMYFPARRLLELLLGEQLLVIFVGELVLRVGVDVADGVLDDAEFLDDLLDVCLFDEAVEEVHFFVDLDHLGRGEEAHSDGESQHHDEHKAQDPQYLKLVGVVCGEGLVLLVVGQQGHHGIVIFDEEVDGSAVLVALLDLHDDVVEGGQQGVGGDVELVEHESIGDLLVVLHSGFVEQVGGHHVLRVLIVVGLVVGGEVGEGSLQLRSRGIALEEVVVEVVVGIGGVVREQFVGVGA